MTGRQDEGTFWGAGNVRFLNLDAGEDMGCLVCEKVLNYVLMICVFSLGILFINMRSSK